MSLIDQIIGAESGGNASAKNPNSSASGLGQFIDSTWLSMLAKHRPDLAGSPQELLALKSDPQLSRAMTEAYAADNGQILQNAGLPVTPASQYLAHFAGPQGAVKLLSADPSAPVETVLGAGAVNANPFLKGMTAADLQAWASRKMGQPTPSSALPASPAGLLPSGQGAPAASQIPANALLAANLPSAAPQQGGAPSIFNSIPAQAMAQPPDITFHKPRVNLAQLKSTFQPRPFGGVLFRG
jgi:hypothetical protein